MNAPSKAILVVEDDQQFAESLRNTLSHQGFTVVTSTRPGEAIPKLHNQKFSCILVDLRLQSQSGTKVIHAVRSHSAKANLNAETPIIIMSGHLDAEVIKSTAGQVQGVLAKPFNTEKLLNKIAEVIRLGPVTVQDSPPSVMQSLTEIRELLATQEDTHAELEALELIENRIKRLLAS